MEFYEDDEPSILSRRPTLRIAVDGPTGGGKTWFGLTGESRVGALLVDPNGMDTAAKASRRGIKVLVPKDDLRAPMANPMRMGRIIREAEKAVAAGLPDPTREVHKEHMERIQNALGALCMRDDVRTILIDGAVKIHMSASFAEHGRVEKVMMRDRGEQNRIMTDIFQAAAIADKHLVVTSEADSRWVNVKKGDQEIGKETQFYQRKGWRGLGGAVRVEALMLFLNDSTLVDRANYIMEDHWEGYEGKGEKFWKRVKRGGDQTLKVNDYVMWIKQSKDNTGLLSTDRDGSVLLNREITFAEVYSRVWGRDLEDE